MFRLFIALNLLFLNLFACDGGFDFCKLKVNDTNAIKNQQLQIPVEKNKLLIFSKKIPNAKIIKHDPFLSLYLIEDKNKFKYPFRINNNLTLGTAAVNRKMVTEGKILKHQIGLNSFATYSEPLSIPSILVNSCCTLEGLVTPDGIIEKEFIERFLKIKEVSYSDIGIRVHNVKKAVIVDSSNPFMKNNQFKKDDRILEFDGKNVIDSATLMRNILFSDIGSTHKLKIKRGKKILTVNVKSQKRYGGGYLSDTFLEFLGISFDKNLCTVKIEKKAQHYKLKIGDQLLQVNTTKIRNEQDILEIVANTQKSVKLLFQREEFQFFVTVN
ncbi:PDZ domain-containing protein [Candidatus Sulfurimonas marisnigri]|uniref:PDZ domain-containing protein n=1 Tax=Candidatus Sulfurimonas marisnigri TaxID=2740405 RepID=A0A7S7RQY2_9BACT|nr:PDZ domain-containing protein [Candidatus Sulfurimonas marisnigri]QOY54930.1 PDZ domain-containing protein [Candidatus Sulfurimonas marisnigri]